MVYSVGHAHDCSNIGGFPDPEPRRYHAALAVTKAAAGTVAKNTAGGPQYGNFEGQPAPALYNWFPDLTTGTFTGLNQAAWSVVGTTNYLVIGGEFTEVNGVPQQGLVRLALPRQGAEPTAGADGPPARHAPTISRGSTAGTAVVRWPTNWDRDERTLTYEVLRDGVVIHTVQAGSTFWKRPVPAGDRQRAQRQHELQLSDPGHRPGRKHRHQCGHHLPLPARGCVRRPPSRRRGRSPVAIQQPGRHHVRTGSGRLGQPEPRQRRHARRAGASAANTGTAASVAGTSLSGSSTSVPEASTAQGSIEFWFKTAKTGGTLVAFGASDGVNTHDERSSARTLPQRRWSAVLRGAEAG